MTKPFLGALVVLAITAPAAAKDQRTARFEARAELLALEKELHRVDAAIGKARSLEGALVGMDAIGARLDVFELRFNARPQQVEGWASLSRTAKELLGKTKRLASGGVYFNKDSASVAHAVLLELAGHSDQALKALRQVKPGGGCGNWHATVMLSVRRRISGIQQRQGQYAAALATLRRAHQETRFSLYFPQADLFFARYGYLQLRCKERPAGIQQLQRVVDLFPGTRGSHFARQKLDSLGELIEPTAERLQSRYTEKGEWQRRVFALAGHKFPQSRGILTRELAKAKDEWEKNRLIPALGILGDEQAIPALRRAMAKGTFANATHALQALDLLGDDQAVKRYLDRLLKLEDPDLDWAYSTLEDVCGGGPDKESTEDDAPPDLEDPGTKTFVAAWKAWLAARKR